ncbi:MAG TPA: MEDS domain-containing protein [Terriglobales bacterium]|nr:MEDS domain-containing protein [Terriglobales bacterium]
MLIVKGEVYLVVNATCSVIHSVHFYEHDEALIQRLRSIIVPAIDVGNSVIVVATEPHRQQLKTALAMNDVETEILEQQGRFIFADADELLATFMVDGFPDRQRFFSVLGHLAARARQSAWNAQRGVTVFGEMVAALWEQGNRIAALQLESLWNDLLYDREFHLHCAYPRNMFRTNAEAAMIRAICDVHSHVVGRAA